MNDLDILEKLKSFIEREIASKIKLEIPEETGELQGEYKLDNPSVYIGWIPPKSSLTETEYTIPSILIMSDGGDDSGDEASINTRLVIATYDPGTTLDKDNINLNCKGYKDLLNVITKLRIEFSKQLIIEDLIQIEKPIRWKMYDEQMYPYWHGQMEFSIKTMPIVTYNEFL